ncbi:MAG: hypothetical protein UU08_C0014G0017 [Candidatus Uhrbacteria bacterium GW2011_GWE2_40_58]|nr:MAG: hypothetical protein UT94_C0013G0023 [Candidatus Uhrbacteria bacterium GW2011_GWF2_40_263]KKR67560.1 MAG: hypothetical protein UU08_C0014G0017 [Candidatus Uhrbacteria bacterium GW2011_GWE2_40_58]
MFGVDNQKNTACLAEKLIGLSSLRDETPRRPYDNIAQNTSFSARTIPK